MSEDKPKFAEGGVIKGPTIWPWFDHRDYPGEEILPLSTIERIEEAKKRMADIRIAELEGQVKQWKDTATKQMAYSGDTEAVVAQLHEAGFALVNYVEQHGTMKIANAKYERELYQHVVRLSDALRRPNIKPTKPDGE